MVFYARLSPEGIPMRIRAILAALLILMALPALVAGQAATATDQIEWDQAAPDLATAAAYMALLEVDGVERPAQAVTCTGVASPFVCSTSIPAVTPGPHTVRVRVSESMDGVPLTSDYSVPLSFMMRAVPATPGNPRVVRP